MPCDFEAERPNRYRFHDNKSCQFDCSDQELINYREKNWCPAHLPYEYHSHNDKDAIVTDRWRSDFINRMIKLRFNKHVESDDFDYIDLSGIIFPELYIIDLPESLPNIIFSHCKFFNGPNLGDLTFLGDTWFEDASFAGHGPSFNRSVFKKGARFDGASFCGSTSFAQARFDDLTDFSEAKFDSVVFSNTCFNAGVYFSKAEFRESVRFNSTKFCEEAIFVRSKFHQGAFFDFEGTMSGNFSEAEFNGRIDFSNGTFRSLLLSDAKFSRSDDINSSPAIFGSSKGHPMPDDTALHQMNAKSRVYFEDCTFDGHCDYSVSHTRREEEGYILPAISFAGSQFRAEATFENRVFGALTNFSNTVFDRAPEFHGCVFHQNTSFYKVELKDHEYLACLGDEQRSAEIEKASRAFRTLKFASESARGLQEQAYFFAHEERRNRMDPNTSWPVKTISLIYDITSEYGRNYLRPAYLVVGSTLYFFFLYAGILQSAGMEEDLLGNSVTLTVKQIVRPFWIWSESAESISGINLEWFYVIRFFASIQSFLTILFITLFLLALRRRFRIS